jgi:hypothetical protein
MSSKNKPQSGVESILQAIEKLQANALNGNSDSVLIDPENTRPFDKLDTEFGAIHNQREE